MPKENEITSEVYVKPVRLSSYQTIRLTPNRFKQEKSYQHSVLMTQKGGV